LFEVHKRQLQARSSLVTKGMLSSQLCYKNTLRI